MDEQWQFISRPEGWSWRVTDAASGAVLERSQSQFETMFDCMRDAELHGFHRAPASRAL